MLTGLLKQGPEATKKTFIQFLLLLLSVVLLVVVFNAPQPTEASHFQFGTYEWQVAFDKRSISLTATQAWRYGFFWSDAAWSTAVAAGKSPSVGSLNFCRLDTNTANAQTVVKSSSKNLQLTLTGAWADPLIPGDGYFFGRWIGPLSDSIGMFAGTGVFTDTNQPMYVYFNTCCRIGGLMDGNSGQNNNVSVWIASALRTFSLQTTGFPREYIYRGVELRGTYELKARNRDDLSAGLTHTLSPTSYSSLVTGNPGLWGSVATNSRLFIRPNSTMEWKPNIVVSDTNTSTSNRCKTSYCPYAISVTIDELNPAIVYKTSVTPSVPVNRLATMIDWLFVVIAPCTTVCPPAFLTPLPSDIESIATVPTFFIFSINENSTATISLENTPLPSELSFTSTDWVSGGKAAKVVTLVHDTDIDSPMSSLVCFHAVSGLSTALTSIGSYCPSFRLVKPNYVFMTGIVREFAATDNTNRIDSATNAWSNGMVPTSTIADKTKRTIALDTSTIPTSSSITASAFSSWWDSTVATKTSLATLSMVSYFNDALDTSMAVSGTYADDKQYLDPRRRIYSFRRAFWTPSTAKYYTVEFHTTFDLLTTETTAARSLKFGVTGGELFVYIADKLVFALTQNAALSSPTTTELISTTGSPQITQTKTYAQIKAILAAPGTAVIGTTPESYSMDIFYTQRSNRAINETQYTGFHMEFGSSTQCSALAVLNSGQYQSLIAASTIFDYSNATTAKPWDLSKFFLSNSRTGLDSYSSLRLLQSSDTGTAASIFYNDSKLKVLNGFSATFTFRASATAPGFAFVMQSQSPSAKGSEGQGMGYAGISNAVAVEFDVRTNDSVDTGYNYQHISIHRSTPSAPSVTASETTDSWPMGSKPVGNMTALPFAFNNGTTHDIRIEFLPSGQQYWLYVYVNKNIRPLYTAQLPRADLDAWYQDGAYVGFTTANYATVALSGQVNIDNFKMVVIPPLAVRSTVRNLPSSGFFTATAGEIIEAQVQLRDACDAPLLVRGETDRFVAKFIHRDSRVPFPTDVNADPDTVYDIPAVTITDVGGGIYSFTGRVTRAGQYQLYLYYQEMDLADGEGQPIGQTALTYTDARYSGKKIPLFEKGLGEPYYSASIGAGVPVATKSVYVYPPLTPSLDNAAVLSPTTTATTSGLYCIISPSSLLIANNNFVRYTSYADIEPTGTDLAFCTLRGLNTNDLITDFPATTNFIPSATVTPTPLKLSAVDLSLSLVFVKDKDGLKMIQWSYAGPVFVSHVFTIGSGAASLTQTTYLESWAPLRLSPSSLIGRGMVLFQQQQLAYGVGEDGLFYIYTRDRYGNAVNSVVDVSFTIVPSMITRSVSVLGNNTPFTICPFFTGSAGVFQFQAFFNNNPVQIGPNGSLIVAAGPAHYSTSQQSNIALGGSVDQPITFVLSLYDISGNLVNTQNASDYDVVYVQWVRSVSSSASPAGTIPLSAIITTNGSGTAADGSKWTSLWDPIAMTYSVTLTPTFAGTFSVKVFINPPNCKPSVVTDPCLSSNTIGTYEMTSSKGKTMTITPGPLHTNSLVNQVNPTTGISEVPAGPYTAGTTIQFNIQTKDSHNNDRYSTADGTKAIKFFLSISSTKLTSSQFTKYIDTAASTLYKSNDNYLTGQFLGSGVYSFSIVFSQSVLSSLNLQGSFEIDGSSASGEFGIISTSSGTPGTATWPIVVNPGLLAQPSTIASWCPSDLGTALTSTTPTTGAICTTQGLYRSNSNAYFVITPKDKYGNLIATSADNYASVRSQISFSIENNIGSFEAISEENIILSGLVTITIDGVVSPSYIGYFVPKFSGLYEMKPSVLSNSVALNKPFGSPTTCWLFASIPSTSYIPNSIFQWPSLLESGKDTTVSVTDVDLYGDKRVSSYTPNTPDTRLPDASYTLYYVNSASGVTPQTCAAVSGASCAPNPSRPSYQCTFRNDAVTGSFTYYLMINKAVKNTGADAGCVAPTNNACPTAACSSTTTLVMTDGPDTDAFIGGISLVSGTESNGSIIAPVVNQSFFFGNTGDKLAGLIRAGGQYAVYIFSQNSDKTAYLDKSSMSGLRLRLLPLTGSSFQSVTIDPSVNPTTVSLGSCGGTPNPTPAAICVGRANAGYYRVLLSDTKTSTTAASNSFAVYKINASRIKNTYSTFIRPAAFDPLQSIIDRSSSATDISVVAGSSWKVSFSPVDLYNNAITSSADFISWPPTAVILETTNTPRTAPSSSLSASTVVTFVNGNVQVVVNNYYITMGLFAYNLAAYVDTKPTTSDIWKTKVVRSTSTLKVTAAPINMAASSIALIASTDNAARKASWKAYPPQAGIAFEVYLYPVDQFGNPTAPTDPSLASTKLRITSNDRWNAISAIKVESPTNWVWSKSPYSTTSVQIYTTEVIIDKTSRNGFGIVCEQKITATALTTATTAVTAFFRSQPVSVWDSDANSKTALYNFDDKSFLTKLTNNYPLTIDSTFKFRLRILDPSSTAFLYNIGTDATDDNSQVMGSLTAAGQPLAVNVVQDIDTTQGISTAIPGVFTISAGDLLFVGTYTLTITVVDQNGSKVAIKRNFMVNPGKPIINYTEVQMPEFQTGTSSTVTFQLYDRLHNKVTQDLTPSKVLTQQQFYSITQTNKVYPSIHQGMVNCFDVHDQANLSQLTYAIPPVTPASFPNYQLSLSFESETSTYSATITPQPSGLYTFNLTYIASSLSMPDSVYGCNSLIPLSFNVKTGPPVANKSYYQIRPLNTRGQLTEWGTSGQYVGYAGQSYQIDVFLLDRDGNHAFTTAATRAFFNPSDSSQLDPLTAIFYQNDQNTNILSLKSDDLMYATGVAQYRMVFSPKTAKQDFQFRIFLQEDDDIYRPITGSIPIDISLGSTAVTPSPQFFTVLHGAPKTIVVSGLAGALSPSTGTTTSLVAGAETSFYVSSNDAYGNPVTTNTLSTIQVVINRDSTTFTNGAQPIVGITGLTWVVPASQLTSSGTGITTVQYTPSWEGNYSIQIIMTSLDGTTTLASSKVPTTGSIIAVHATCAGRQLAASGAVSTAIYMCSSTGDCVTDYSLCPAIADRTTCPVGQTRATPTSACVALTDASVGSYVQCPDGSYVTHASYCIPAVSCPSGTTQCANDKTQCRSKQSDCAATPACPNGTIICPNGLACAASLTQCPTVPSALIESCQSQGKVMCPTGSCVAYASDCPTKPSCPLSTDVYCLTDGSCQANAKSCPQIPAGQIISSDTCVLELGHTGLLCPTGDKCVKGTFDNCPSQITCPVGNVLCALDNTCKTSASLCLAAGTTPTTAILPDATTSQCSRTEFRCPNGECVQNLVLCSAEITCPASTPVLCADKTCKASLAVCTTPPTCATGFYSCPATGSCVSNLAQCSAPLSCPAAKPVLCPNSQCVSDISLCGNPISCPPSLPYACPTSFVCRETRNDCPTLKSCSVQRPMVCDDGSCAISVDMCSSNTSTTIPSTGTPTTPANTCDASLIRCTSGECSPNVLTCPSTITCPLGTLRCDDGTCRDSCAAVSVASCSDRNLITCPQSASGIACAKVLSECPQGLTCPVSKPVRCIDSTCALTSSNCPSIIESPPATKSPCPDGSWITGNTNDCPTAVTCPPSSPIKCYDQTCKARLEECPIAEPCDLQSETPFRCPSGLCAQTPWDCLSVDPSQCPTEKPIKCPGASGNICVAALSACPNLSSDSTINTTKVPDSITTYTSPCTPGFTYCRDGSCQESPSSCPVFTCPVSFSALCDDGSCAVSKDRCTSASGCPWDRPIKCSGVGSCVKSLSQCPASKCSNGLVPCADGSCATNSGFCLASNGCRTGQQRCSDGSCVDSKDLCIAQSNSNFVNSCPPGAPFKCSNGLCVAASYSCPQTDALSSSGTAVCPKETPVLCADGICRQSTELCPIIKPCQPGTERCNDGFCRSAESNPHTCPAVSNCPLGQIRCKQQDFGTSIAILDGICAEPGQCLAVNGCPISGSAALQRCPSNGRCVSDLSTCHDNVRQTNGCLSSEPFKCWNGKCATSIVQCDANNNCPFTAPVRCGNGECVAAPTGTQTTDDVCVGKTAACSKITCADGSCKDKASECVTSFGCPVTTPVRCADGQCRALPASYRPFLSNELVNTLTCQPIVSCPANYQMCESGSCVLTTSSCPSIPYNCSGDSAFRCLDNTCRPSQSECGKIIDPSDPTGTKWIPSSAKPAQCPSALPVMCDNGSCVSDIFNCDRNSNPETTTITGSPSSSQRDSSKEFQVLCEDGSYRDSYAECRKFAQEINDAVSSTNPALKCIDYCGNGRCVLEGKTVANVCGVIPACSVGQNRCVDGSCRVDCSAVPPVAAECDFSTQSVLNIDGVCRTSTSSLRYDGCYHSVHERYQCANRECAASEDECTTKETRKNDEYQRDRLDNSQWGREHYAKDGKVGKAPKVSASQAYFVKKTSFKTVPNTLIAEMMAEQNIKYTVLHDGEVHDTTDTTTPTTPITPTKSKSCTANCVSQQKALTSSILYSSSVSSQSYPVGPLSTGLYLTLSSGLLVDNAEDTNLYIQPVAESQYFNATNKITYSRIAEFDGSDALTAAQTVLSPAFSCTAGLGITEPFAITIGVSSLVDRSMTPTPQPADICLARLRRFPEFGYATWECIYSEKDRKSGDLKYSVRQSPSQPLRQAISAITQCYDDDLSTIVVPTDDTTGEFITQDETTTTTTTKVPAVYAFIHSPVNSGQVYLPAKDNFWKGNVIWLLFVIIGGIFLIFVLVYAILRLSRYSSKTDKIKDEIANTEKEVEEMEQFGEKRRDLEVGYQQNPLAVSLEQQRELEETTSEEKLQRKKQIMEAQQADSAERKEVITSLENDNDAALAHLEQLRKKANKPGQ